MPAADSIRERFADPVSRDRFVDSESALTRLRGEAADWIARRQRKDLQTIGIIRR